MSFWQRTPAFDLIPPLGDQPGPARPLSEAAMDDLIEQTLDLASLEPEDEAVPHVWRRPRRRHIWKMAAVTVLALGGMAAAAATTAHVITVQREATAVASAPRPVKPRPVKPRPSMPMPMIEALARSEVPAPEAHAAPAGSRDLLAQANQVRRRREWTRAERLYTTIIRDYAGTDESYAASVAAASLRLEHLNDTDGALALYGAALRARPNGALAEEALYGIAESMRSLGKWRAERKALKMFLDRFPKSMRREQIEQRLADLKELLP